jgi:hypothetical protein
LHQLENLDPFVIYISHKRFLQPKYLEGKHQILDELFHLKLLQYPK